MMKSTSIPIIKNKVDTNKSSIYRPIALFTAMPKLFKLCLSEKLNDHLTTSDNQFGFKFKKYVCIGDTVVRVTDSHSCVRGSNPSRAITYMLCSKWYSVNLSNESSAKMVLCLCE